MLNPDWLRTFCTLAEVGHFTRTAERLHMTQSGVSQQVRRLEDAIGVALLDREGRSFTLSEAGRRLVREAEPLLMSLSELRQRVVEDSPHEGVVRVMSPGSLGLRLYPRLLDLQTEHPGLVVDYRFAPNAEIDRRVAGSRVDIGFMTAVSALPDVACEPVSTEALLLVTPADVVEPEWATLAGLGFIDHPDAAHHASLLLGANYPEFQHVDLLESRGFSNQIGLILEPVARGLGFTVLPSHAVDAFARPECIRAHRLPEPVHETVYRCVHRQRALQRRMQTVFDAVDRWL